MSFRHQFETVLPLHLGDDETKCEATVTGTYLPATRGRWFVDPEPPEPEAFEIDSVSVTLPDGRRMTLPDLHLSESVLAALEAAGIRSARGFETHCIELAGDLRTDRMERSVS